MNPVAMTASYAIFGFVRFEYLDLVPRVPTVFLFLLVLVYVGCLLSLDFCHQMRCKVSCCAGLSCRCL